jgi:defect-in-organelle-trafficking protein DotD
MFFVQQDKDAQLPSRQVLATDNVTLNRAVHIDWSGPVEQLLSDLAMLTGFHIQVIGASPIIPPLVTLHHERIKILDVVRDAALQVHQKADLIVFPDERLIELRYR